MQRPQLEHIIRAAVTCRIELEDTNSLFVEYHLKRKGVDKMNLAVQAVPHMKKEIVGKRFDLAGQIGLILDKIRRGNS